MAEREPTLSGENACRQNDKLEITHATQYLAVIVSRKKLRSALESPCSPLLGWPAPILPRHRALDSRKSRSTEVSKRHSKPNHINHF